MSLEPPNSMMVLEAAFGGLLFAIVAVLSDRRLQADRFYQIGSTSCSRSVVSARPQSSDSLASWMPCSEGCWDLASWRR